jgi:hypothetical protein
LVLKCGFVPVLVGSLVYFVVIDPFCELVFIVIANWVFIVFGYVQWALQQAA